jgi:tetratricopeptide (TPR) repeat protein
VLEHALEIEPRHRYATCGDFADDLEAILEGRPVRVVRTGPLTRGFRFLHRRPSVAAVLALLLVLVVVGASWGRDAYAQHLVDSELAYARNNAEAHSQYALGDLQEADRVLDLVLKEYPERLFPRVLHVLSGCSSDSPGSHKTLHRDPKRLARARLRFAPIEQRTDDSLALGVLAAYLSGAEPPEDRAIRREHRSAEDLAAWVAVMHFLGRDVEIARRLTAIQKLGADHLIQIAMTVVKDDELDGFALSAGHAALALLETPVTLQVLGLRYVEIGERSGRVGDFELGLSLLRRAQLKQPENWRLKHNLGYGLAQTAGFRKLPDDCDERRQAERLYREVLSVRPENAPTLFNLANLLLDRKPRHHSEEALRLYERVEGTHGDRIGYWRSRLWSTKYLRGVSDAAKLAGVALQRTKTGAGYAELLLDRVQFMSEAKASIQEIRKAVGLVLPYLNQRDGARVDEFFVAVAATRDSELVVDIWREFIRKVPLPLWTIVERFHKDHGVPLPPRGFKKR